MGPFRQNQVLQRLAAVRVCLSIAHFVRNCYFNTALTDVEYLLYLWDMMYDQ